MKKSKKIKVIKKRVLTLVFKITINYLWIIKFIIETNLEQIKVIGQFIIQNQNCFVNNSNPSWRNHPNLRWRSEVPSN